MIWSRTGGSDSGLLLVLLHGLGARAACPVVLARGENDHMVTDADLRPLGREPVTLPGLGHNAHVEGPGAVVGAGAAIRSRTGRRIKWVTGE